MRAGFLNKLSHWKHNIYNLVTEQYWWLTGNCLLVLHWNNEPVCVKHCCIWFSINLSHQFIEVTDSFFADDLSAQRSGFLNTFFLPLTIHGAHSTFMRRAISFKEQPHHPPWRNFSPSAATGATLVMGPPVEVSWLIPWLTSHSAAASSPPHGDLSAEVFFVLFECWEAAGDDSTANSIFKMSSWFHCYRILAYERERGLLCIVMRDFFYFIFFPTEGLYFLSPWASKPGNIQSKFSQLLLWSSIFHFLEIHPCWMIHCWSS